jgi:outer membrane lipase/esterase
MQGPRRAAEQKPSVGEQAVMSLMDRKAMGRGVIGALALVALAACGGGGDGDQSPKLQISRIVSFGDSLSDVGSYNTTNLAAAVSGRSSLSGNKNSGKFTVNSADAKNWIELIAAQYGVAAPCPAQTGLTPPGDANSNPLVNFAQAIQDHDDCFAYGQGGARVTNPKGPGNALTLIEDGEASGAVGQLTRPLVAQVAAHLGKNGGAFSSGEFVLVLAGGNDLFINADNVAEAVAGGDPAAIQAAQVAAVTAMGVAGGELAALVKQEMVAKGAEHVVVVNLPDVSLTPDSQSGGAGAIQLALTLTTTFNNALAQGLADAGPKVLLVDAFTQSQDQFLRPAQYDLSNVTTPACDLTTAGVMLFASSLVCNSATLTAGDKSKFLYADGVHPTPYGYKLLAQFVTDRLVKAGLL